VSPATPILFVSHEGTLTGAPMMLLHFLRWLRDNTSVEPEIALLRGGPLAAQFAEIGPTTVLGETVDWPAPTETESRLAERGLGGVSRAMQRRRIRHLIGDLRGSRIVYLNSIASLRFLHHLPRVDTAIVHVHELQSALRWAVRPEDPPLLRTRVDHVVAAADCVADNLVRNHGVDRQRVSRVYEFVDTAGVLLPSRQDRTDIRAELGLDDDALVIGGSGFADWRKGIDLFVQMARAVAAAGRDDVHFVWVGARAGGSEGEQLDFDIRHAGVEARLHLVGLKEHRFDWYRAFDVLALTSREDPYPLVALETALLEVPMVCFDAGGMTELVARSVDEGIGECGVVVPYIDVEAMAEAALDLLDDEARRQDMGQRAAKVVQRDHDVQVAAPELLHVIERVLGRSLA
jgi:glycosyltransferase involved in cell wall biosynthesis